MDAGEVAELKLFVEQCKSNPSMIHHPSLAFFKSYLQSLGAQIPAAAPKPDKVVDDILDSDEPLDDKKPSLSTDDKLDDDIIESDVELDNTGFVVPDNDPPQKMGDSSIEVTEENRDAAQISKSKAIDAISEGKLHEAIDHLTEAVILNPSSGILYATRASVFVKLNKPNAAMRDADAALQINPDSAKGYKIRGMARAMLGQWEEAAKDLHVASNLDHDEEIGMVLKKVESNARKKRELRKTKHEKQQQQYEAQMGGSPIEVTEENQDAAQMSKSKAIDAISEGKLHEAIGHLTEAVMLNPSSAILYATRASVFIKLNQPNAAIRDAVAALQINPDTAKGYKIRGMARAMLGQWEEATSDLHAASNLDHDEEIGMVLKKVESNARKKRELRKAKHEKQQQQYEAQMGGSSIEGTEENQDAAQMSKSKAIDAISEGKLHEALDHLTEAAMLNPSSAILYATRASVFVKLNQANAAICDAEAALQINPDSAKGYKIRGMARAMLGQWEKAASDLHAASNLDHDEEIGIVLKKVEYNARKERELRKTKHEKQQLQYEAQMGGSSIEVTEENRDAAQMSKSKAIDAISEGKLHEAIVYLTEAVMLNPKSAILYATRASVFVKLNQPNAAIRDADAALQINPDLAKGYKMRGMAQAMLGQVEEAARDLHVASNLDYDEEISMVLKKISRRPQGLKLELETLPVDAKAVADGDTITVYVSTVDPRESSSVPRDVQTAAVERSKARALRDYAKADALHKKIVDSGYRVLKIQNEEILARKYRIRLRGIDAPEGSMPYGQEAKEELVKLVQGKCLKVLVFDEDRYGRSVGDIYCDGIFVQESMLKKGLAWHYKAYDQRAELEKWEKEARAKRVGLWASSNPEMPWEWRKDRREGR